MPRPARALPEFSKSVSSTVSVSVLTANTAADVVVCRMYGCKDWEGCVSKTNHPLKERQTTRARCSPNAIKDNAHCLTAGPFPGYSYSCLLPCSASSISHTLIVEALQAKQKRRQYAVKCMTILKKQLTLLFPPCSLWSLEFNKCSSVNKQLLSGNLCILSSQVQILAADFHL